MSRAEMLRDTIVWHPHAGRLDRATYDVTLRWPEEFDLLASGRPVAGGSERGVSWTRRKLDIPAIGFSFEFFGVFAGFAVQHRMLH